MYIRSRQFIYFRFSFIYTIIQIKKLYKAHLIIYHLFVPCCTWTNLYVHTFCVLKCLFCQAVIPSVDFTTSCLLILSCGDCWGRKGGGLSQGSWDTAVCYWHPEWSWVIHNLILFIYIPIPKLIYQKRLGNTFLKEIGRW